MGNRISKDQRIATVAWLCLCVLFVCVGWYFYITLYVPLLFTDGVLVRGSEVIEQHASLGPWYQDDRFAEKHPNASGYYSDGYFRDGSATLAFHHVTFVHATPSVSQDSFFPRLAHVDFELRIARTIVGILSTILLIFGAGLVVYPLCTRVQRYARRWLDLRMLYRQGKCPVCGYDLQGNVSGVCPECGTPIRESDHPLSSTRT